MDGRIRKGWYRYPDDPPSHVTRVGRIAGAWIATVYDRTHNRPCACGVVVYPAMWKQFVPTEGIADVSLDVPDDE